MTRTATWETIGTEVQGATTIQEALERAGLNYTVQKQPIFLDNGAEIPNRYATVRTDTNETMGIVGNNYKVCQNEEAFSYVDDLMKNMPLEFTKAGQTRGGLIWIIAKTETVRILGDEITPYLIFQNGHNGFIPLRTAITPLRLVCQNQFNLAFKNANTISIRHSTSLDWKLEAAKTVMLGEFNYMKIFKDMAENLALKSIAGQEHKIINEFYKIPKNASEKQIERIEDKRTIFLNTYKNIGDNQNFRGTAWGLLNAYADVMTHEQPVRQTETFEENRFLSVTFDPKAMQKLLTLITV